MNRNQLTLRVRSLTRDFSNSIFREQDIIDYLNEGIDRVIQVIPECAQMISLSTGTDEPQYLPKAYHSLLAVYSASRCFGQDDRQYQASSFMNEFETKLVELKSAIENGIVTILDSTGAKVVSPSNDDYVTDNYFESKSSDMSDVDNGVDGVV